MAMLPRLFEDPGLSFFLFGPRGTGKPTWLHQTYDDPLWIDMLDPETRRRFVARPERLRDQIVAAPGKRVVVIDEIQKAPALLDVVHQKTRWLLLARFPL